MKKRWVLVLLMAVMSWGGEKSAPKPDENIRALRQAVFEAEDSRTLNETALKVLTDALRHPDAGLRRMAVRALGRFEKPELSGVIVTVLSDPNAAVRAEAANALGQSLHGLRAGDGAVNPFDGRLAAAIGDQLRSRLASEGDSGVRSAIGRTIGRLPYPDPSAILKAEESLLRLAERAFAAVDKGRIQELCGAAKGFESLYRLNARTAAPGQEAVARLRAMALESSQPALDGSTAEIAAQVRRLSLMALTAAKKLDRELLEAAVSDPDDQVRRLAVAALGTAPPGALSGPDGDRLIRKGLADHSAMVRYESLRLYGRKAASTDPDPVLAAVEDKSPHVALLAVDLLGQSGTGADRKVETLKRLAGRPRPPRQSAARALVSLAKIAPGEARTLLPGLAADPSWLVRMYAARAAGILKDAAMLQKMAVDSHENVSEAAFSGFFALKGHEADGAAISALGRRDYQLVRTAALALKGSPSSAKALPALFAALARLTAEKRETSRDPRLAILERIGELGTSADAPALKPYAGDFDPRVAESAAAIVGRWMGARPEVQPRPLPVRFVRLEDVERLGSAVVRVTLAGRGVFEMELLMDEAPATAARFVALARAGYYTGLTFHRIVPNFVIQGGSPGANEYMGDGTFMRDEVGLASHVRGAVGISTRGRDTGDAQIFIDSADNVRLDHDYTVFARVTSGMDVVDQILEGDAIERVEVVLYAKTRMKTITKMATDSTIPKAIR